MTEKLECSSWSIKSADENSKKKVYPCTKKWKCSVNLPFTKTLNRSELRTRRHFLKISCSRRCWQTQFSSSTAGFGNEMKLKAKLSPFSLIHIRCQRAFCFRFFSLLHLSKFWYMLTVRLGILGRSEFHVWSRFNRAVITPFTPS